MERRLAAILAADVVGYSRLMGEDEAAALTHIKTCEASVIEPLVQRHRGRIVKRMGDGYLVEFTSVVAAVECAIAWQADVQEPLTVASIASCSAFPLTSPLLKRSAVPVHLEPWITSGCRNPIRS